MAAYKQQTSVVLEAGGPRSGYYTGTSGSGEGSLLGCGLQTSCALTGGSGEGALWGPCHEGPDPIQEGSIPRRGSPPLGLTSSTISCTFISTDACRGMQTFRPWR